MPEGVAVETRLSGRQPFDVIVAFVKRRAELVRRIAAIRPRMAPDAGLWVAWPKRASGVATDVTEDVVREVALPTGLVDNKVCAIAGSSGSGGSGGSSSCDANTSSDWENCGACGRVCRNGGNDDACEDECCVAGQCAPGFAGCFREVDGFATCDEYCASLGETCVTGACDERGRESWRGWATRMNVRPALATATQPASSRAATR